MNPASPSAWCGRGPFSGALMMAKRILIIAAIIAFGTSAVQALDAAKVAPCLGCHGQNGVSQTEGVPSLAAQPDMYTQWQLVFFRLESRKSNIMEPIANAMSDEDVSAFGAYFATLPPPPAAPPPDPHPELSTAAAPLAQERHCNSCHTATFAGQQATARLAGQREEVLVKALEDYRSGARRGTGIAAMPEAVYGMSDENFVALAHYLSRLP
jgi:cytochrome c553